jgi:hypothetical protein
MRVRRQLGARSRPALRVNSTFVIADQTTSALTFAPTVVVIRGDARAQWPDPAPPFARNAKGEFLSLGISNRER